MSTEIDGVNGIIKNTTSDGDVTIKGNDGGSEITALTLDMSNAGKASFNNDISLNDDRAIRFGAGDDLSIFHDSNNSYIRDSGTGSLIIQSNSLEVKNASGNESVLLGTENGAVTLYHDNAVKLATTATGATVTGTATVGALSDGTVTKSKIAFHQWKLTSNLTVSSGAADITAGMTQIEAVGSVLSVSSGVFTFPYTGKWFIQYQVLGSSSGAAPYRGGAIALTTDGSNFSEIRNGFTSTTANTYYSTDIQYCVDITNVSTHKVKFRTEHQSSGTVSNGTNFAFTYLGDT